MGQFPTKGLINRRILLVLGLVGLQQAEIIRCTQGIRAWPPGHTGSVSPADHQQVGELTMIDGIAPLLYQNGSANTSMP